MRSLVGCLIAASAVAFAACGPGSGDDARTQADDVVAATLGCGPRGAAAQFDAFLAAISARDRKVALRYVARRPELLGVTLCHGEKAGARGVDASSPRSVYEALAAVIPAGEPTKILAVGVGGAPFADEYAERSNGRTRGVEFVARIGGGALEGKIGVDCDAGRIYLGAMHTARHLHPQALCGKTVRFDARSPLLCQLD